MRLPRLLPLAPLTPPAALWAAVAAAAWLASGAIAAAALLTAAAATALWAIVVWRRERDAARELISRADDARPPAANGRECRLLRPLVEHVLASSRQLRTAADEAREAQRQAELRQRLAQAEARKLLAMLDGLADPLLMCDPYGRLLSANRAAAQLFAFDAPTAAGRPFDEIVPVEPLAQLLREIRRRSRTADPRSAELQLTAAPYRATVSAVRGDSDELLGFALALRNIAREKAAASRSADFVSAVSHELRAPLSGIKAYAELLADGKTDPQNQRDYCQLIDSQVERMVRLIDNLLNLARIEAGVVKVNKVDCDLNEILAAALRLVRHAADEKNIELIDELSHLYIAVHVDRDMLGQAAINLLSNAIKYTPPGGRVCLRSCLDESEAAFEVRDNGIGIPEADQPRLFERFYRVKANCAAAPGTGLGLALVRHIAEDVHGGRVRVESAPGQGSRFILSLPLGAASAARPNAGPKRTQLQPA